MASRRSQPYRKGARQPGSTLYNMTVGRPLYLPHPSSAQRAAQRKARRRRRGK